MSLKSIIMNEVKDPEALEILMKAIKKLEKGDEDIRAQFSKRLDYLSKESSVKFGMKIMPLLEVVDGGKAVVANVNPFNHRWTVRVNAKMARKNPDVFVSRLLPKAFAQIIMMRNGINTDPYVTRKIMSSLIKEEVIELEDEPDRFNEYEYSCACRKKWFNSKIHHRIYREENPVVVLCKKCNNDFRYTGQYREITPDIVVKQKTGILFALDNMTREIVAYGYIAVKDILEALKPQGKKIIYVEGNV